MNQNTTRLELDPRVAERIGLSIETLADLCKKWGIESMALFGSVLREDFTPDSDIDFLVSFRADVQRSLLTRVKIKHELEALIHRSADVINRKSIENSENWIRRREILTTARTIYEQE